MIYVLYTTKYRGDCKKFRDRADAEAFVLEIANDVSTELAAVITGTEEKVTIAHDGMSAKIGEYTEIDAEVLSIAGLA